MSMNSMFNNMFGKIQNGMCRLSMDGLIAIKTSSGYILLMALLLIISLIS